MHTQKILNLKKRFQEKIFDFFARNKYRREGSTDYLDKQYYESIHE